MRYADDFVMGFQYCEDAQRCLQKLKERLAKFGLEVHRDKVRLIELSRFAKANRERRGAGRPETFDFLGFTHICARRRSDGGFTVWRRMIAKRIRARLHEIKEELRKRRHEPVADQGRWLQSVMRGGHPATGVPTPVPLL